MQNIAHVKQEERECSRFIAQRRKVFSLVFVTLCCVTDWPTPTKN